MFLTIKYYTIKFDSCMNKFPIKINLCSHNFYAFVWLRLTEDFQIPLTLIRVLVPRVCAYLTRLPVINTSRNLSAQLSAKSPSNTSVIIAHFLFSKHRTIYK